MNSGRALQIPSDTRHEQRSRARSEVQDQSRRPRQLSFIIALTDRCMMPLTSVRVAERIRLPGNHHIFQSQRNEPEVAVRLQSEGEQRLTCRYQDDLMVVYSE
jgi:hypothetical protein